MCGICGFFSPKNHLREDLKVLKEMTDALSHRGPDAEGFLTEKGTFFGHRRLKILDLEGGVQPMTSQDGRMTVIFNGEIFNFEAIRESLEKKGRKFITRSSDTESLLQLFHEKKEAALPDLEGMFAFAMFDRAENKVTLAVDRFGKKPLYYTQAGDTLIFASELKSLLKYPGVSCALDESALAEYLVFEYVPAPKSILKNIYKLEAGTFLEVSSGGMKKSRYYRHRYKSEKRNENEWREAFLVSFKESVRRRLISDVPLGVFLSGGLDSSSVLAIAKSIYEGKKVKTFTIEFEEPEYDESPFAREVSHFFGTEYLAERCSVRQMMEEHESILSHLDEPFADASFLPTFMLCRLARRHVTVALAGDGGDELFAGYNTFQADALARRTGSLGRVAAASTLGLVDSWPLPFGNLRSDFRVRNFLRGLAQRGFRRHQAWMGAFTDRELAGLLSARLGDAARNCYERLDTQVDCDSEDPLLRLQAFFIQFYLQGDILVKADRASMANALEVRAPLLDDSLVALLLSMPSDLKLRDGQSKYLFKAVMKKLLPPSVLTRRKKGFSVPIGQWIRGDLKGKFKQVLSESALKKDGFFNPASVKKLLEDHLSGRRDNEKKLWSLYVFQLWRQRTL